MELLSYSWAIDNNGLAQRLTQLQSQKLLIMKAHEAGADREQWFITYDDDDYVLFVEHLSESAWVEATGTQNQDRLHFFYKKLLCDTSD